MSEITIDPNIIRKTQETLGKFVKKPILTDKLLKRPPFRFLHDVIKVVIKETGYFSGLYTDEELNSDNIKDRDGKMQFLQKLIDVTSIGLNEEISVRSSKIVAGQESDKTNELLQAIGKIIENKIDLTEAINIVKNTKKTKMKTKSIKNEIKNKSKIIKENSIINNKDKIQNRKKLDETMLQNRNKEKKINKEKLKNVDKINNKMAANVTTSEKKKKIENINNGKKNVKDKDDKIKTKSKISNQEKNVNNKIELSADNKNDDLKSSTESQSLMNKNEDKIENDNNEFQGMVNSNEYQNLKEPKNEKEENVAEVQDNTNQNERNLNINSESLLNAVDIIDSVTNKEIRENNAEDLVPKPNSSNNSESLSSKKSKRKDKKSVVENFPIAHLSPSSQNFMEQNRQSSENEQKQEEFRNQQPIKTEIKRQSTFVQDMPTIDNKTTTLRPPSVRPPSARPGAPRRRDKNIEIVLEPNDQIKMAGINVKLDKLNANLEDDGENLVIIENSELNQKGNDDQIKDNNDELMSEMNENSKGHLVQQILETQKELIQMDNNAEFNNKSEMNDMNTEIIQKRHNSAKQIDSLRDTIQNLTRSINPLGKLMDFIPEDIDSMQLELTMWRDIYLQAATELKKEKLSTESAIQPLKNQLKQIDDNIEEYTKMINAIRAKILANSHKISSLLLEQ